jgi:sulfonate transport system permease protein
VSIGSQPQAVVRRTARRRIALRRPRRLSALRLFAVLLLLVVWQVVSLVAGRTPNGNDRFVPGAVDIVRSFDSLAYFWQGGLGVKATALGGPATFQGAVLSLIWNSGATALRLASGLAIGSITGIVLAVVLSWSTVVRRMALLPAHLVRMLPLLAVVPLFSLWFGNSELGAILFVALGAFSLLFVWAMTAIGNVPRHYRHYAQTLGAGRLRIYLTVELPAALPSLRGGLLLALGFGWSGVIAAEFLGQQTGLGRVVVQAQFFGRTNTLAVVGLIIVVYAAVSYWAAARVMNWACRWAE